MNEHNEHPTPSAAPTPATLGAYRDALRLVESAPTAYRRSAAITELICAAERLRRETNHGAIAYTVARTTGLRVEDVRRRMSVAIVSYDDIEREQARGILGSPVGRIEAQINRANDRRAARRSGAL